MPSPDTIDILNRAFVVLQRSLPQYLRYSRPYIPAGKENIAQTIEQIVAAQDKLADRISQYIFESGGLPDRGKFPIEFTDTHDLEIDFLVHEAIGYQKEDIAILESLVDQLRLAPAAQSLAAEALGLAKGQLESLQELSVKPGMTTRFSTTPAFANDMPVSAALTGTPHRQETPKLAAGDPHAPA